MDAQPSYRQCAATAPVLSCRQGRRYYCARWGLIGLFGVLAFLFSAVSPDDDDIQQEFVQANRSKQFVLATYRSAPNVQGLRIKTVRCALVPPRPLSACCHVIGRISVDYKEINGAILSSRTGDRSPPSESF
jgi:hypothetical protein